MGCPLGAVAAVPRRVPSVLTEQTWDYLEIVFLGSFVFSLEINPELQQVLLIPITFFDLVDPMTAVIPSAKACASRANVPPQNNLHLEFKGEKMTEFWPKRRGLFQTPSLLHPAPSSGPREAEPGPAPALAVPGAWGGADARAPFVPRLPHPGAKMAPSRRCIKPREPSHEARPGRAAAKASWG